MTESTTSDPVAEDVLAAATVQVTGADGHIGGLGVLIAPTLVLTCAHVVLEASGRSARQEERPDGPLGVGLVLREGEPVDAVVRDWVPVRANGTGDVAVLSLSRPLPQARPVLMVAPRDVWDHRAIVFGLPRDDTGGGWHTALLRARTSTGRLQMSPLDGQSDPIQPGFSGSAVWDEDLGAVVGIVASISPAHRGQSFCIPTRTILDELPDLAELLAPSSPFPGLRPYTEEHSAHFFGRDEDVTAVVDLLCPHGSPPDGCVTLTGPSGSGKSSLLMAGVLPRLKERDVEVVTLRAEGRLPDAASVGQALRDHRSSRGLVLAVDQAEALLLRPEEELSALVDALLDAGRHPGVAVLVALRTDFQDAALRHPGLSRLVGGAPAHQLGLMTREQLTEVVRLPLRAFPGVEYDSGLADRLIEDAAGRPGALPLLGFVLTTLWDRQVGGRLRLDTYRELGGLGGVLSSRADSAWQRALRGAAPEAADGLLRALIQVPPGSGTALRARLARRDAGEDQWAIARELAEARVLVLGADPDRGETVELAHEALIEHWQPLADRLEKDRAFLTWRGELRYDRTRWWRAGRPDGLLLEDPALSVAVRMLGERRAELTDEDREFIEASVGLRDRKEREAARSERRKRYLRMLWAVVTVLAVVAATVVSVLYLNLLREQRRLASDRLAQQAASLDSTSLTISSLYAVGAYRAEGRPDARSALLAQYLRSQDVERVVMEGRNDVEDIALTDDGSFAYTVLANGDFVRLDLRGKKRPVPRLFSKRQDTERIAVSADGRRVARASDWGLISLGVPLSSDPDKFRTIALREGEAVQKNPRAPNDLRFDGDRKRILAAIPREGVLVWNADDGRRTGRALTPPRGWDAAQAWFAAGDTVVARIVPSGTEADDVRGRLVSWDLDRGSLRRPWDERATASATVSGNGRVLVTCTEQGSLEAWRLGTTPRRFQSWSNTGFQGLCPLYTPRLDVTGRYLVNPTGRIGNDLGRMRFLVIDLEKGWPATFDTPAAAPEDQNITGRSFAPAVALAGPPDDLRAAVSVGGSIVTVRVKPPTSFDSNSLVNRIRTPDGPSGRMAVVDTSGSGLQLWNLAEHRLIATARPSRPLARLYAAFSPDGRRMMTIAQDERTVLVWRIDSGSLKEEHVLELPAPPGITASGADPQTGLVPSWINLSFSDDDHAVISGLSYVSRWNLDTGKPEGEIYRPPVQERAQLANEAAGTFAIAIPGKPQAVVRTVAEIGAWDFTTGEFKRWIKREDKDRSVRSLALSPDGKILAVQYAGGRVQLRDVEKKRDLPGLTYNGVYYLGRFLGDRLLHTTTAAGEQVVWDIDKRQDTYRYYVGYGSVLSPSTDGKSLTMVDGSRTSVIPLEPERWMDRLCALAGRELTENEKELAVEPDLVDDVCPAL